MTLTQKTLNNRTTENDIRFFSVKPLRGPNGQYGKTSGITLKLWLKLKTTDLSVFIVFFRHFEEIKR